MKPPTLPLAARHVRAVCGVLLMLGCGAGSSPPPASPAATEVRLPDAPAPSASSAKPAIAACAAPAGAISGLEPDDACGDAHACERACDAGGAPACVTAGNMDAESDHPDRGKELRLYERACRLGNVLGCTNYGATVRLEHRDPVSLACAARLFALACAAGEAEGCAMAGAAYARGEGVPQDRSRALQALLRGCDGALDHPDGVATACEYLVGVLQNAPSSPLVSKAIDRATRIGCRAGSSKLCAAPGPTPP